jgi:hypothetical protein
MQSNQITSVPLKHNLKYMMKAPGKKQWQLFILVVTAAFIPLFSNAQGTIKTEEVDIIKPYQPLLADAEKIEFFCRAG